MLQVSGFPCEDASATPRSNAAREAAILFVSDFSTYRQLPLMESASRRHRCDRLTSRLFVENFSQCFITKHAEQRCAGIVIDTDLSDQVAASALKKALATIDRKKVFVVVITDPYRLIDTEFAVAVKADRLIPRIAIDEVAAAARPQLKRAVESAKNEFLRSGLETLEWLIVKHAQPAAVTSALLAGELTLDMLFQHGERYDHNEAEAQASKISAGIMQGGLDRFIGAVREHHDATYRHSLAVAGITASFAYSLLLPPLDTARLTLSGLLHDIGKAKVPIEILEKKGPLSPREELLLRQHPALGRAMLEDVDGIADGILDVISQHHEYLDGSGYPCQLSGSDLGDMVRLTTIADHFAHLITSQTTAHLNRQQIYDRLVALGGKLDQPLVRALRRAIVPPH